MSELYEILRNSLDETGLPVMDRDQFKEVTDKMNWFVDHSYGVQGTLEDFFT